MSETAYLLNCTQLKFALSEAENEDGNRVRFVSCNVNLSDSFKWNAKIKI